MAGLEKKNSRLAFFLIYDNNDQKTMQLHLYVHTIQIKEKDDMDIKISTCRKVFYPL